MSKHLLPLRGHASRVAILTLLACASPLLSRAQQRQPAVSLALSSATVAAQSPVTISVSVSDASGPVTAGVVDLFDSGKPVATVQVVTSHAAGFTPGTATLRRAFAAGSHSLQASFRPTVSDAAATSAAVALQVTPGPGTPSATPFYTQTQDLTYGTELNTTTQVLVIDLNNDGFPDLIERQASPGRIAISLGDPAHPGQFLAPTFLSVPDTAVGGEVVAVDYDADGLTDLIVQGGLSSAVTTKFHNNPSQPGTFTADGQLSLYSGPFVAADLNGDGLPDIAFSSQVFNGSSNSVNQANVLFNDPANPGQFDTSAAITVPQYGSTFVADLNGDGRPDLILGSGSVAGILLADPANPGKFLPESFVSLPGGGTLQAIADVTGDGVADLLVSSPGELDVLPGNPAQPGTFGPVAAYPFPTELVAYAPGAVRVADINSDGYPDVVTGTAENHLVIFYGQANGTLSSGTTLVTGPANPSEWQNVDLALADLDGDGLPDIVSATSQTSVQIFAHQQTGTPLVRTAVAMSFSPQPVIFGNTLTLTAQVTSTGGVPTGSSEFYSIVNGSPNTSVGTANLVNGTANLPLPGWMGGANYIAVFHGDAVYAPSESSLLSPVGMASGDPPELPTNYFSVFPLTTHVGTPVTISAREFVSSGTPTGTIQFIDGYNPDDPLLPGTVLASVAVDANGFASVTLSLSRRTYSISAALVVAGQVVARVGQYGYPVNILGWDPVVTLSGPTPANPTALQALQFTASVRPELASRPAPTGSVQFSFTSPSSSVSAGPVQLDANGNATATVSTLQAGTYVVQAAYQGDTNNSPGSSNPVSVVVTGNGNTASTTSLAVSPASNPALLGDPVTLTATVKLASGSATGSIEFVDGYISGQPGSGTVLATVPVNANGQASFTTSSLTVGTHSLGAVYMAGGSVGSYTPSATSLQIVAPVTLQLSSPIDPDGSYEAFLGDSVGMSATVVIGNLAGSGSVEFLTGYNPSQPGSGTVLATVPLGANGQASFTTSSLAVGTYSLGAVYLVGGSIARAAPTATVLTIHPATPVVTFVIDPAGPVANQATRFTVTVRSKATTSQPVPTGKVQFTAYGPGTGSGQLGTMPLDATGTATLTVNNLQAGSYDFYAEYLGDPNYNINMTEIPKLVVAPDTTTVTVQPSITTAVQQEAVTFKVTVGSAPSEITSGGTVTLLDGSATLATGPVDNTGTFSTTASNLALGSHTITAQYLQNGASAPRVSSPVSVTVVSTNFPVTISTPGILIASGQSGTLGVSPPSIPGLVDTITFSCSNLPVHASCSFNPATVALGQGASTTLTIKTTDAGATTIALNHRPPAGRLLVEACLFPFGLLSLAGVARSRRRLVRRLPLAGVCMPIVLLGALSLCAMLSSCASGPSTSTPPGTYTFQVTAKGTTTALVGSTTVTLTVTQ